MNTTNSRTPSPSSISKAGIEVIAFFEGLERRRKDGRIEAYLDTNTKPPKWTICYGHTATAKPSLVVPRERCLDLKRIDLAEHERAVRESVPATISQGTFDALVSFSYNVGTGKFKKSKLPSLAQNNDTDGMKKELQKWVRAGGKVLPGLVARRKAEADLIESGKNPAPAKSILPPEPIAYRNSDIRLHIDNPNTLWSRARAVLGV